jgi:hypothetical protein
MERVDMIIPHAMLYSEKDSGIEYEIKMNGSTAKPTPLGKVAEIVGAKIILNKNEKLLITGKDSAFPELPEFPEDDNAIYTLYFNNDCGTDCDDTDDFGLYYDLIYDAKDPKLEFRAGRKGTVGKKRAVPDGNCDPIMIKPPPG